MMRYRLGSTSTRVTHLRKKAPQIIAITLILLVSVFILIEVAEDFVIENPLASGPLISAIIHFTSDVTATVSSWGYPGIFGLMILESSSLPLPSEVVLPFAGYLIYKGNLDFWVTVFVATVAAIVGSLIDYYIGLKGIEVLTKRRVLGRVIFSMDQIAVAGRWFQKYGALTIFLARLIPVLRTIISFPAGAAKMPLPKFLVFTATGCFIWNSLLIYVGYYLGTNWIEVAGFFHNVILVFIAFFIILVVVYLFIRKKGRKISQPQATKI